MPSATAGLTTAVRRIESAPIDVGRLLLDAPAVFDTDEQKPGDRMLRFVPPEDQRCTQVEICFEEGHLCSPPPRSC